MSKPVDLALLEPILAKYQGQKQSALLPLLHEVQAFYGWLPREVQMAVAETLRVPLSEIHGVIEFYTMFYNEPRGRRVVRVCEDIACQLAGAEEVMAALSQRLNLDPGGTDLASDISLEYVQCLGLCEHAPAVLDGRRAGGNLTPDSVPVLLAGDWPEPEHMLYGKPIMRMGFIEANDCCNLAAYKQSGGYQVLQRVIGLEAQDLLELIDQTGILGRGGAMFPLGRKWSFTQGSAHLAKHIVVNADESEPGTFKDRYIMERDPFAVIEAATVAAYTIGAEQGWIFIRGEYPRCQDRLEEAIVEARKNGYLGKNILGKEGFDFDIELRVGAGAYICGEETALFEAIEGKRGFPRIKPPFPTTHGLFGEPTAINNVETLVTSLTAMAIGIDEWRQYGTEQSPGTKLFCLSGHVQKPGLYEVPFGTTLGELIDLAGGVPEDRELQAVLLGGAAGVFVGPEMLAMPLTYEDARANNVPLGSGVVMVFDERVDLRASLYHLSHFFAHESCGKCFPCQLGTQRQMEILQRISTSGTGAPGDKQTLTDVGLTMTETSLCGLGQTAASAILSAVELWPELVE